MKLHTSVIFLSGAATLSLELLASRVMTPYFGVSLFIWSGILSITLVSLALGYYFGGRLTHLRSSRLSMGEENLFFLLPGLSGISIGLSCLFYPHFFPKLSQFSPVSGAYIASIILLLPPLIAISAMNPLLISIKKSTDIAGGPSGDKGAGHVFFLSTLGSVLGVLITAFVFIPNLTNFFSILMIGALLSSLSLLFALGDFSKNRFEIMESLKRIFFLSLLCYFLFFIGSASVGEDNIIHYKRILAALLILSSWFIVISIALKDGPRRLILRTSATGLTLCLGLLYFSSPFLSRDSLLSYRGFNWKIEKEYTSLFGNIKILHGTNQFAMSEASGKGHHTLEKRVLFHDGLIQNTVNGEGISLTSFTYALEHLAKSFKPDAKSALVLGLGAGVVPASLARQNIVVDVVEVNPSVLKAAKEYFAFNELGVSVHQADARTFVKECPRKYDLLIVDLFQGDGTPDYLLTREFFHDLNQCLDNEGVALFNTFMYTEGEASYYHILKTLHSGFEHVKMFYQRGGPEEKIRNVYLAAMKGEREYRTIALAPSVPESIRRELGSTLSRPVLLDEELLKRASINSDENNFISFTNVDHSTQYRRQVLHSLPEIFLVN